jgi:hypothetical protein
MLARALVCLLSSDPALATCDRHVYRGLSAHRAMPEASLRRAGGLALMRCCMVEKRVELSGRLVFVPLGADLSLVEEALRALLDLPTEVDRNRREFCQSREDLTTGGWPLARSPYRLETNRPGVFAVGDVRGGNIKRVASAVVEGSIAVAFVHQVLHQ